MPLNRIKNIMKFEKETFNKLYLGEDNDTLLKLKEKKMKRRVWS